MDAWNEVAYAWLVLYGTHALQVGGFVALCLGR